MALIAHEQEVDSLAHLEERIQKAVALVARLRQEKDAALKQLADAHAAIDEGRQAHARLSDEVEGLRAERQQVRARIEKLLGQIDLAGAA